MEDRLVEMLREGMGRMVSPVSSVSKIVWTKGKLSFSFLEYSIIFQY